jgi:hypothetical protein
MISYLVTKFNFRILPMVPCNSIELKNNLGLQKRGIDKNFLTLLESNQDQGLKLHIVQSF